MLYSDRGSTFRCSECISSVAESRRAYASRFRCANRSSHFQPSVFFTDGIYQRELRSGDLKGHMRQTRPKKRKARRFLRTPGPFDGFGSNYLTLRKTMAKV